MSVLKIATYSLNTRWFTAVAATLMIAFITQLYGFNVVVPYSFKLRGRLYKVKEVVNKWLDQTIQDVIKKRYCVITSDNLTCLISYDISAKKWYFDQVKD